MTDKNNRNLRNTLRNTLEALKKKNAELKKSLLFFQKISDKKKVLEIMENWYRNDKTCSGKPHCLINECDLCVVCFKELKQAVEKI